ncbi:hypothetical protein BGW80DRAFT_747777 [Lactifluus volemus]|nr:hypothetical protein BGW80DRAFT_747777 [Lactifluus volemus]
MSILESASTDPTLDASGVLTWKLLEFIKDRLPSGLEKRGSRRLDEALRLAREHEYVISTRDMDTARARITRAMDTKEGLELRKGPRRYVQAKEYNKSAKAALQFVKVVLTHDIKRDLTTLQTVSDRAMENRLGRGLRTDSPINGDVVDPEDVEDLGACAREISASMRHRIAPLVENMYGFNTSQAADSISSNARRAQKLLRDMNFVYETRNDGTRRENGPYRHPIIQRAINISWFRDKNDVGAQHHEHFTPMPERAIALTLTVIECCIDEWSDGTRRDSTWDSEKFRTVYNSHISSFSDFKAHCNTQNKDPLEIQRDLIKNAR